MKSGSFIFFYYLLIVALLFLYSCKDIIEPSISRRQLTLEAPSNNYQSTSYTISFWWDEVEDALSYHLQVVTPDFTSPGSLVLDTVVTKNKFLFNLSPGNYQWRVLAQNGSTQTTYATPKSFTVVNSSIKQQSVQLISPANNLLTNQNTLVFQWGNLYGAIQYRFEIDTNNFVNESSIVSNLILPGQQTSFTFPRDKTYQWRVRAENDTAMALWSAINLVTYDHTQPAQVSIISPKDSAVVSLPVTMKWNAVTTAAHYKLYVYQSDGTTLFSLTFPLTLSSTSYSYNQGTSGNKIFWKVSAVDAAGNEGTASPLISFTLQ